MIRYLYTVFIFLCFFNTANAQYNYFQLMYFNSNPNQQPIFNFNVISNPLNEDYEDNTITIPFINNDIYVKNNEYNTYKVNSTYINSSSDSNENFQYLYIPIGVSNKYANKSIFYSTDTTPYTQLYPVLELNINMYEVGQLDLGLVPSYNSSYRDNKIYAISGNNNNYQLGGDIMRYAFYNNSDNAINQQITTSSAYELTNAMVGYKTNFNIINFGASYGVTILEDDKKNIQSLIGANIEDEIYAVGYGISLSYANNEDDLESESFTTYQTGGFIEYLGFSLRGGFLKNNFKAQPTEYYTIYKDIGLYYTIRSYSFGLYSGVSEVNNNGIGTKAYNNQALLNVALYRTNYLNLGIYNATAKNFKESDVVYTQNSWGFFAGITLGLL